MTNQPSTADEVTVTLTSEQVRTLRAALDDRLDKLGRFTSPSAQSALEPIVREISELDDILRLAKDRLGDAMTEQENA